VGGKKEGRDAGVWLGRVLGWAAAKERAREMGQLGSWADAGKEGAGPGAKGEGEGALGRLGPCGEGSEEKRAGRC